MPLNSKIFSITAGSLLGIAFIFFVVANAVPEWYVIDFNDFDRYRYSKFCEY
jgi:hypothetical protein